MKNTLLSLSLILVLTLPAFAGETKTITLKDGSRVKGELVSIDNGFYVIQTPSMGEVRVADQNVAAITTGTTLPETQPSQAEQQPQAQAQIPANLTSTPEFKNMQTKVMSNPAVMTDIQTLIQDPEVMAIMSDPSFLAAVQSGNTASLQTDPRMKKLSSNPKVQALIEKIKSQQQ